MENNRENKKKVKIFERKLMKRLKQLVEFKNKMHKYYR